MAKERSSGAGDPARTLELLWRDGATVPASRRGPRQGLTVDAVVEAAVGLADEGGLDALTMRAVAQRLGVTPMTLYTYVPGKAELLDLMLDAVFLKMPRTASGVDAPWRERVTAVADENRALYLRHPWLAELRVHRPPLGPGVMTKYEHELGAFEGLGLDDVTMDSALTHLLGFVQVAARTELDARAVDRESALSDEEWWAAHEPLLERMFDAERFPLASRVGEASAVAYQGLYSPDHAYAFGLARVLDGLAALIPADPPGSVPQGQ
ncbi:TetR/AcrR family transcriptional regulator [Streptomyces lateritius]|uniref:TetR/AcrR family transcriptional regulator n=1 Tax=Streptomyces lateritius TaxID=67313 RepID=UPI0016772DE4|nr:TetR/AcrR family transcriptional regulator [Streptomyces lateritius]GGT67312.1 TetR family transcriptional regulator [Streptomyces lateritius]